MKKNLLLSLGLTVIVGCSNTPPTDPVLIDAQSVSSVTEATSSPTTETMKEPESSFEWGQLGIYSVRPSVSNAGDSHGLYFRARAGDQAEEVFSFGENLEKVFFRGDALFYLTTQTLSLGKFDVATGENHRINTAQGLQDGSYAGRVGTMLGPALDLVETDSGDLAVLQWQHRDNCTPVGNFRVEAPPEDFAVFENANDNTVEAPEFGPSPEQICFNKLIKLDTEANDIAGVYSESARPLVERLPVFSTAGFPTQGNTLEVLAVNESQETVRLYWESFSAGGGAQSAIAYDYNWSGDDLLKIEEHVDIPVLNSNNITPTSQAAKNAFRQKYLGIKELSYEWQVQFDGQTLTPVRE